jgi:hexokinase
MKYSTEVTGFLKRHGFVYDSSLFGKLCEDFSDEMSRGLSGKSSSLDMIPTYISTDGDVDYSKNVIVIDAGGTNFRAALVHFDSEHRPVVDYLEHYPMPGTGGAIDRDEFYPPRQDSIVSRTYRRQKRPHRLLFLVPHQDAAQPRRKAHSS